jgi:hypothetical protein
MPKVENAKPVSGIAIVFAKVMAFLILRSSSMAFLLLWPLGRNVCLVYGFGIVIELYQAITVVDMNGQQVKRIGPDEAGKFEPNLFRKPRVVIGNDIPCLLREIGESECDFTCEIVLFNPSTDAAVG